MGTTDWIWLTRRETFANPATTATATRRLGRIRCSILRVIRMHFTYASPNAAEYYRKNGKFTDGTVLVKEILGTHPCAIYRLGLRPRLPGSRLKVTSRSDEG